NCGDFPETLEAHFCRSRRRRFDPKPTYWTRDVDGSFAPHARTRFAGGRGWRGRRDCLRLWARRDCDPTMEFLSTRGTHHGHLADRCTDHAPAPAHAARHADARFWIAYAAGLRSSCPALRRVPWACSRHRDARGHPPLPT